MATADALLGLLAERKAFGDNTGMPGDAVSRGTIDASARTRALMTWLTPRDESWALQGVRQQPVRNGRDVVQGLALASDVAEALATDVNAWLAVGQMGCVDVPPGLSPELTRILTARLSQIRAPQGSRTDIGEPVSMAEPMRKSESTPPQAVRDACKRGLELAPEHGGPGLTEGAKDRARSMAGGGAVSDQNIQRMVSFFSRHGSYPKEANPPSPGYVAWQLWGGDAGKLWANSRAKAGDEAEKACGARHYHSGKFAGLSRRQTEKGEQPKWKRQGLVGPGGARATAERKAKQKGKGKAYANAIYARFVGKR